MTDAVSTGGEPAPAAARGWHRLLVEPARPERIRARPDAHWLVVATVCVGAFLGQLNASIVTLALPTLRRDFGVSVGAVEWVALSYLLVLVGGVVAVGRFADMAGRKLLYIYGFAVFIAGAALCGLAPDLPLLVAARAVQAVGAAMLQANSVALIVQAMPPGMLGRGIGVQGAAQAVGLALGTAVGGLLISAGGWRLIFLVNIPPGLLGMVLGWYLLPRSRDLQHRERFDWSGAVLFLPAVAAILLALTFGDSRGWTSAPVLGAFAAAVLLGALFLRRERAATHPMVDLALFRNVRFRRGILSGLLSYLVMFGVLFVIPFYLERAASLSPAQAGLQLTALPVALGLVAPFAGRFSDTLGARTVTAGGMLLAAAGLLLLAVARQSTPAMLAELALIGAGLGAFTPANNAAIMGAAPRTHSGVAGGILNMTRGLGTSLGVALTGLVYTAVLGASHLPHAAAVDRAVTAAALFLAGCAALSSLLAARRDGELSTIT